MKDFQATEPANYWSTFRCLIRNHYKHLKRFYRRRYATPDQQITEIPERVIFGEDEDAIYNNDAGQ